MNSNIEPKIKGPKIPFGCPMIGAAERAAVMDVLAGPTLTHGPRVQQFESAFAEFTGAPHALAVSSCTAALRLTYMHWGLGPGDEVIVPAQTHTASAHAVELCGAKVVFIDSESQTGNIDVNQIEDAITDSTRAICVVHFLGLPVEMDRVLDIARRHKLFVIEDCALALGAKYHDTHVGLLGDVGCFSFYPVKHITTAEGGMLITRHDDLAESVAKLRAFGIDRNRPNQRSTPGQYDVELLGDNCRMTEIAAAIGCEQIKRLDGFLKTRQQNHQQLKESLKDLPEIETFTSGPVNCQPSHYCYHLIIKDLSQLSRNRFIACLNDRGIGTSIYYPHPVPLMSYYRSKYGIQADAFAIASRLSASSVALPVGPHLTEGDCDRMIRSIKDVITTTRKSSLELHRY